MGTLEVGVQSLKLLKGSDEQHPFLHRIDHFLHARFQFNDTAMHARSPPSRLVVLVPSPAGALLHILPSCDENGTQ
jgi:hypothetical protein